MRIHYLQHVPFEDLGYIRQWADQRQHSITKTSLYKNEPFPEFSDFDCLMVFGGPMGVYDTTKYPWLNEEKRFIEGVIHKEKPVLGICLGAQLIVDVLGARVFKNKYKEIGWHVVSRTKVAEQSPMKDIFPKLFYPFHWHGDTFDLPDGAIHLAQSEACLHQAFSYGQKTIGLQFHLESSKESIEHLIEKCQNELVSAPYIQSAADILEKAPLIGPSNDVMKSVLSWIENNCSTDLDK